MEDRASLVETLFEKTEHYVKASAELYKLRAIDKSAEVLSTLAAKLAIVLFLTMFFLVLNIGVSLWAGEILGKTYYGFFLVAGVYAFAATVLYLFRNSWIKMPMKNSIITQALN